MNRNPVPVIVYPYIWKSIESLHPLHITVLCIMHNYTPTHDYWNCTSHFIITDITYCRILSGFTDSLIVEDARYAWKYAASRGITGTPQYIVNGVQVPDAPDYSQSQWEGFINKLVASPAVDRSEL